MRSRRGLRLTSAGLLADLTILGLVAFACAIVLLLPLSSQASPDIRPLTTGNARVLAAVGAAECGTSWRMVSSPNVGTSSNLLYGIDTLSGNNAWAVGHARSDYGPASALVLQWNGAAWNSVPSPNVGLYWSDLRAVSAISATDVWAVGRYSDSSDEPYKPMSIHWDGEQWASVPISNPSSGYNELYGVSGVASDDVWAVGNYANPATNRTEALIEHWDGNRWSIMPGENAGDSHNYLSAVSARASNDVWAVGGYNRGGSSGTLVLHWDGISWSVIPSPSPGTPMNFLRAVTALERNNVWAVGETYNYAHNRYETLVLHWNGTLWSVVPSPNTDFGDNELYGIAAVSTEDIWAVGHEQSAEGGRRPIILHWNGADWRIVPGANTGHDEGTLWGVSVAQTGDVWAAGWYYNESSRSIETLLEAYKNRFSDVPLGSTFEVPISCLACRGIISGYADGTFRPNNQVTRGQLAKIVTNAAGFIEDPGAQIFEDVPSENTFYQWINRLTRRGYMSGYACGGVGEPCTTGMPYFRPFANATRGQTSKIVSNAAGFVEEPTDQTFEDVPPTHTFYREIQRLASRNIMGGYPCGGVGEPCLTGKPYFRPQNNVTRGQSAKIVANTFFPGCQTP